LIDPDLMNEPDQDDVTAKAEAAFRQAARKVIRRAMKSGMPVIVSEDGQVR
jgi:hypothetical protein